MNDLYLILHKVRGEPTFDIAEQMDDEKGWIIPTSGHRAHPILVWHLAEVVPASIDAFRVVQMWPDWLDLPDHYQAAVRPKAKSHTVPQPQFTADDL
jgi:hypothetical protein